MILIIPLDQVGDEFKKNGYKKPKALINIFGKPILYYLLDNLNLNDIDFISIPYHKEYSEFNFEDQISKDYPNITFKFIKLNKNSESVVDTINISLNTFIQNDTSILYLDGDNFYSIDIINLCNNNNNNKIITFENKNEIYPCLNSENNIFNKIDKRVEFSSIGAYRFSSYKELLNYSKKFLLDKTDYKKELDMLSLIYLMMNDSIKFDFVEIDNKDYHPLKSPIQLKYFYNNYPKLSCLNNKEYIKNKRICFDLDNLLVTYPKIKYDYTTVEPIEKNINFLKYIKSFGHTIIIYTSRGMKDHNSNMSKILCNIGKITFDTLEKYNIPFDEIYFGKPYADVYIDNLATNRYENLEKELGFYMDNINPRDYNQLEKNTIEIYTKKSNDLSGEIYYYQNIPVVIKDLFPLFLDYDPSNKWYTIEKIQGITVTNLFLSELLTTDTLIHIMKSIKRIQQVDIKDYNIDNLNIYDNYANKLEKRYKSYDYSKFKNHKEIYNYLFEELTLYEKNNKGNSVIIHGDTVMTNILINNFGKIKFIDMRGKLGDQLTICGDFLYDWAKLYQSLIGYDKILMNKNINEKYEKSMLNTFENYFISLYSKEDFINLKLITKSLLFTLIPLHNNQSCYQFYSLIDNITSIKN